MRILFVLAALFALSGCETLAADGVYVSTRYGHHYNHDASYISYTLGFYSGHNYNGYNVYGSHGYRYYYAPRYYSHHRYYARPRHYVQPGHHYVQPRQHQPRQQPRHQTRNDTHRRDATPPHRQHTPPQPRQRQHVVPSRQTPLQVNNRHVDREVRSERRRGENRKRK